MALGLQLFREYLGPDSEAWREVFDMISARVGLGASEVKSAAWSQMLARTGLMSAV
jgi:hypothetical protein